MGYIARTAKNFGINKLYFINPRANIKGKTAITYSKHAHELLENAKTYATLEEAILDCDIVIGSTGIWEKAKSEYKNAMLAEDAAEYAERVCRRRNCKIGLIIGRDDIGMKKEELAKCDVIAYIPTNPKYPVLNISHALAIFLYEFSKRNFSKIYSQNTQALASKKEIELLFSEFGDLIKGKKIRNKKTVMTVFRKLIINSKLNRKEIHALITALK